jgi:hypothetical protein
LIRVGVNARQLILAMADLKADILIKGYRHRQRILIKGYPHRQDIRVDNQFLNLNRLLLVNRYRRRRNQRSKWI